MYLVQNEKTKQLFAMKVFRKDYLIDHQLISNVTLEKTIMSENKDPFLINLLNLFHNDSRIYFIMPYIPGGNLTYYLQISKRFSEDVVKLYTA